MRKKFIVRNEPFVCGNCGYENPPLRAGCRNHCRKCLYSLHVDLETPGDRESECGGLMKPVGLDYSGKKGYVIVHQCEKCGKKIKNKAAEDDDQEALRILAGGAVI